MRNPPKNHKGEEVKAKTNNPRIQVIHKRRVYGFNNGKRCRTVGYRLQYGLL